jgi:phosphate/sulfate permease
MIVFSIVGWLIFCIIVGAIGSNRKIGFAGAFFLSLFLSPLIGLIISLFSKSKSDIAFQDELLETQKSQTQTIDKLLIQQEKISISDEIQKAKNLLDIGAINQEEFDKIKKRLMDSMDNNSNKIILTKQLIESEGGRFNVFVERLTDWVKESIQTNMKDTDFLRGAMITLSLNDNCGKIIDLYNEKNNSNLFDDIKSIKTKKDSINFVLEPLINKGFTTKM